MKYQIGDTVLVLHSNEEGKVVEIINEKMTMIEVDGISFPVYNDQIDFPYFKMFTEKKLFDNKPSKKYIDDVKKEKHVEKIKTGNGVALAFFPVFDKDVFDDNVIDKFKLYLINQTDAAYHFDYDLFYGNKDEFQLKNQLEPLADFYLHDIQFEDMNNGPRFEFEFSLTEADKNKTPYYEVSLKPKAKQLFKKMEEMQLKNEPSFSFNLFEQYPDKIKDEKFDLPSFQSSGIRIYDASKAASNLEPARSVIDLHIEKLTDSWKHLSNFEILTIQLKTFEKYYELAIAHYQPTLIIIHGVGVGKLRDEIHSILKNKREVKLFVNQYHPNYGYGATEIHFSYN